MSIYELICYVLLAGMAIPVSMMLLLVAMAWNELRKSKSGEYGEKS